MAWGDLRYDHSDIFGSRARQTLGLRKDAVGPGSVQWETILELARRPEGATLNEIGEALQHKSVKGATARLVNRMMDNGALVRRRKSRGIKGTVPFRYFAVMSTTG